MRTSEDSEHLSSLPVSDFENPISFNYMESSAELNPSFDDGQSRLNSLKKLKPLPLQNGKYKSPSTRIPESSITECSCINSGAQHIRRASSSSVCSPTQILHSGYLVDSGKGHSHCNADTDSKNCKFKDPVSILRIPFRAGDRSEDEQENNSICVGSTVKSEKKADSEIIGTNDRLSRRRHSAAAAISCSFPETTPRDLGKYVTRSKWISSGENENVRGKIVRPRGSLSVGLFSRSTKRQLQLREKSDGVLLEEGGELPTRTLERLASLETVSIFEKFEHIMYSDYRYRKSGCHDNFVRNITSLRIAGWVSWHHRSFRWCGWQRSGRLASPAKCAP